MIPHKYPSVAPPRSPLPRLFKPRIRTTQPTSKPFEIAKEKPHIPNEKKTPRAHQSHHLNFIYFYRQSSSKRGNDIGVDDPKKKS